MTTEAMRAAFEAWWLSHQRKTFPPDYDESRLKNWGISHKASALDAWQAALAYERERIERLTRELWEELRKGETP